MKIKALTLVSLLALAPVCAEAQSELYPQHFDLEEITITDPTFKDALDGNAKLLLKYDADRLMAPFIRQAGLHTKSGGKYYGWLTAHPSFTNWGLDNWSLEGHVGGHYLTALALAYAAEDDASLKTQLKEKLDYCLEILKDCQDAYANNTQGLKGFIGGQPINQVWTGLYANNLDPFRQYGGWVPFYCQHKVLAGLRDAWIYADSELARDLFRGLSDWTVNVVSNLSESDMQTVLGWEHGGVNETLADAYRLFGDAKYLTAAKKYSHQYELNGMQSLNTTFLDGQHANTQVPKFIGFERIYQEDHSLTAYRTAARNFWQDVATNRTVCIGGNSTNEHFFNVSQAARYINDIDGPESCNSNNMLKLSEDLFDDTHDARYADFYEQTMYNHILSTRDPKTGGYVYFTTLRPQGYRIYSQVNQGMWCCVGTGMENHSKYAHFAYTHSADNQRLYVNLFFASELNSENFVLKQETSYPFEQQTRITVGKAGSYIIAVRHPAWAGKDYSVSVNGEKLQINVKEGTASYVQVQYNWSVGDVITVDLPMSLRYEECPGLKEYVAFKYGPILLAARTTAASAAEARTTGLEYEQLQNEYGGEGRMDHSPGVCGKSKSLSSAALLIGDRDTLMNRVKVIDASQLKFSIQATPGAGTGNWDKLTLEPFYAIHHARYQCYWYAASEADYANSEMGRIDAMNASIAARTLDFVATGEQQSEAGHDYAYSSDSRTGTYNGETYRDAQSNGYIQYTLFNPTQVADSLAVMLRFTTADKNRKGYLTIDGVKVADITVAATDKNQDDKGFYNYEVAIPASLVRDASGQVKTQFVVRLTASATTAIPGLYYVRLVRGYDSHSYVFRATDWLTGDNNRVAQANISYDNDANTITVRATGNNNVALQLDYAANEYYIDADQSLMIVKGKNLKRTSGSSYLWWLNGVNHGSQVAPTQTFLAEDKESVIVWDMKQSGLDANNVGDRFSICQGMTVFGLTSSASSGTSVISHIGFYKSVDDFLMATGVRVVASAASAIDGAFDLAGRRIPSSPRPHNLIIQGGRKLIK